MASPKTNKCQCSPDCTATTSATYARGHWRRARQDGEPASTLRPLPPPDSPEWAEDAGIIDVDMPGHAGDVPLTGGPESPDPAPGPPPEPPADEPPAHARRDWHAKAPKGPRAKAPRLTAAVRGDIAAKLDFMLEIPGRVWQARDPLCGGAFVAQRPEISRSLTEIVCRSPQLVEWFTGTGGGFIMFLDLGAALFPVLQAVMAHHVYHSAEGPDQDINQSDLSRYAA